MSLSWHPGCSGKALQKKEQGMAEDQREIQVGRDLGKLLLQPPARSRATHEVRPGCSELSLVCS